MIGVTLNFPNVPNRKSDTFKYREKGQIKGILWLVHHPCIHEEQKELYNELNSLYTFRPKNSDILLNANINCNTGIWTTFFCDIVELNGIDNWNTKNNECA